MYGDETLTSTKKKAHKIRVTSKARSRVPITEERRKIGMKNGK